MTTTHQGKTPVLEVRGVNKSFPGVQALKDVSIAVYPNEVVGLVGENGAGKSTLMRILAGIYAPDSGQIILDGKPVTLNSARQAADHGIGMVYQEQSLLLNLSVAENIYLGHESEFMQFGLIRWDKLLKAARRQLEKVEVGDIDPRTKTAELSFSQRQMVELAKVLTLEERIDTHLVILLDEPTTVLEQAEIDTLFSRVRGLKSRASFIFVSHRLDEVLALSDRTYVMRDGQVVAELDAAEADVPKLHRLMVGRGLQSEYYRESSQAPYGEKVVLAAEDLTLEGQYRNINFELHEGEILGIAGVIGSGREALCRTLFGFMKPTSGRLLVNGRPVTFDGPADAVEHGIGYIPQERRIEGLVLYLSVATNITLASLDAVTRRGIIRHDEEQSLATNWVNKLLIRTPSTKAMTLNLSGGNQQKVVLAKWMNAKSRVLILDHPTRGLDVGAKEEVYELVRELTNQGVSIILIADTLEETIGLSHTILVMRDGEVTKRFDAPPGGKPEQVALIEHMV